MRPLAYARAHSLDEAVMAAAQPDTVFLAGGTELLNWMRLGVGSAGQVIDVSRIADLHRIEDLPGGGLRIGAAARLNDVAADPRVAAGWPVLSEAIHSAASAQLRNLATIGGNLLQKTRCAYFRSEDVVPCNRRHPGSGCAALRGRSDRHALFGWTEECGATQPADPSVALAAVDAQVVTRTVTGGRRIPVTELHLLPGEAVDTDTVLEAGELIEALELAAPAPRSAYLKVRERASYEYALVSAAVALELSQDGTIEHARIALGSVALRPWRLTDLETALAGLPPGDDAASEAVRAALADVEAFGDSAFKAKLAVGTIRRAVRTAARERS